MSPTTGSPRRRLRILLLIAGVLLAGVAPGGAGAPAARAAAGCSPTGGMDFLASTASMHVHADSINATNLSNLGTVTITLGDCSTRSVTHFRLAKLSAGNLTLSAAGTGYTVNISAPNATSTLGGVATDGSAMTTDFWGTANTLTLAPGCPSLLNWNIIGLAAWLAGIIPLSATAYCFDATAYGIEAYDGSGSSSLTDNPVAIPGTLTVG